MPDEIFYYAMLNYWNVVSSDLNSISFERIVHGPGVAFKLTENALYDRLQRLPDYTGLSYDDTAGIRIVIRKQDGISLEKLLEGCA